jgi:chemotaxis protein MotA
MKRRYWLTGFFLGLITVIITVFEATNGGKGMGVFFHIQGIVLVFGGTLTTLFTVYPLKLALETFKATFGVFRKDIIPNRVVVEQVVKLAAETSGDLRAMEASLPKIEHLFLRDAAQMLVDRLEYEHVEFILKERLKQHKSDYDRITNTVRGLAKYPPAFGMVGTLAGLVAMMKGLGSSVGAGNLGGAMAIGLTATFYGVAFANLLLLPLGDNMAYKSDLEMQNRRIIVKGILLMKEGRSAMLIQEYLNAMLKFSERIDVLGIGDSATTNRKAA